MWGNASDAAAAAAAAAHEVYFINQCVMLGLVCLVLPVEVWGFCEYLFRTKAGGGTTSNMQQNRVMRRLRYCLMLNAVFVLILCIISLVNASFIGMSQEQCDAVAKSITIIYLLGLVFAYLFFLQRVHLVSRFSPDAMHKRVLWGTEIGLFVLAPILSAVFGWVTSGHVTELGRCQQLLPMWAFIVFAVGNLVLSSSFVYLFVVPLKRMAMSRLSAVQTDLLRIYRRNVIVSSLVVCFTFLAIVLYGILQHIAREEEGREELNIIGLTIMTWDSIVLAACCRLTTAVWFPNALRNAFNRSRRKKDEFISSYHNDEGEAVEEQEPAAAAASPQAAAAAGEEEGGAAVVS